jgi:CDP-glycerol glycerophosphotransferase (TagB/SpsB family)
LKALFLLSDESNNFEESIQKIKELESKGNDFIVISLSILTSHKLNNLGIKYKTPEMFFDKSCNEKLNSKALELAKNWYKPFETELTYRCISIGEMLEYDFYFLFVDTLRSIEIAKKIIHTEMPDLIYIPQNLKVNEPNFECYGNLHIVLKFLAIEKNITVTIKNGKKKSLMNTKFKISDFFYKSAFKFINFHQNFLQSRKKAILFFGVYSYEDISSQLRNKGYYTNKIYPINVKNKFTKMKIREIEKLIKKLENNKYLDIDLEYDGLNLSFLLFDRLQQVFKFKIRELIELIEYAEQKIQASSPSALITMEDVTPIKRSISKLFEINNIPSIVIQHGITTKDMAGFGVMPVESRVQAIWGNSSYRWHSIRGNNRQKITGNPSFDKLYGLKYDKRKICDNLGLNPDEKIILITTSRFAGIESKYTIENEEKLIRNTFKALKTLKNEQIIVKLHPAYQEIYSSIILNLAYEESINIKIFKDSLWDLFAISDMLITFTSTTGLEAIIFDKPVIIIDLVYKEDISGYGSSGAAIVYNQENIVPYIENTLYNYKLHEKYIAARKKFVYDNAYLMDGNSSKRVANLIIDEIDTK